MYSPVDRVVRHGIEEVEVLEIDGQSDRLPGGTR